MLAKLHQHKTLLLALTCLAALAAVLFWAAGLPNQNYKLLWSQGQAEWIVLKYPLNQARLPPQHNTKVFFQSFDLDQIPSKAPVSLKCLSKARVTVNGQQLPGNIDAEGKLDIAAQLKTGDNLVEIAVTNTHGPPGLWLSSAELGLYSDAQWRIRRVSGKEVALISAAQDRQFPMFQEMPGLDRSLQHLWLLLTLPVLLFLVRHYGKTAWGRLSARHWRFGLLALWVVLCAHNITELPIWYGFDVKDHYQYIHAVATMDRLPLANQGFMFYQPPLAYLICAFPYLKLMQAGVEPDTIYHLLRVLPMACGLVQIEAAYRAGGLLFPEREDLQVTTAAIAGFVPVHVYMASAVSNEPVAAALSAVLIYRTLAFLLKPGKLYLMATELGVWLGLSLLAKISVVLIFPLVALAVAATPSLKRRKGSSVIALTLFATGITTVAGWYFLRNWLELGHPSPNNWTDWWQHPAYRTPSDYLSFGVALVKPIYAGSYSIWDGLYATLWADGMLGGCADLAWDVTRANLLPLLSLPLTALLIWGCLRAVRDGKPGEWFTAGCLAAGVFGLLYFSLSVPHYSSIKSSYALGVLPCMALMICKGIEPIKSHKLLAALQLYVLTWLAWVCFSFWA